MHITQAETEVLINNGSILTSIFIPVCILSMQFFDTEMKYKLKVKKHKTDPISQSVWRKCAV